MITVALPLSGSVRLMGPWFIAWMTGLILSSQVVWPWWIFATSVISLSGAFFWWLFLKQHPVSLSIATGGAISCTRADGRELEVTRVLPGVVRPVLVCARLEFDCGDRCDLFVPGGTLPETEHRQLRCALTGFRSGRPD